jgi:hypothetical protein
MRAPAVGSKSVPAIGIISLMPPLPDRSLPLRTAATCGAAGCAQLRHFGRESAHCLSRGALSWCRLQRLTRFLAPGVCGIVVPGWCAANFSRQAALKGFRERLEDRRRLRRRRAPSSAGRGCRGVGGPPRKFLIASIIAANTDPWNKKATKIATRIKRMTVSACSMHRTLSDKLGLGELKSPAARPTPRQPQQVFSVAQSRGLSASSKFWSSSRARFCLLKREAEPTTR